MSAPSGNPHVNLLIRQKHHKPAFHFIFKVLKYDRENDNLKELAIDLYRKGIEELQKSVAMDFSQEKGPTWERAHGLTDKMKVYLGIAKERLNFLESIVKIKHLVDGLSWHAGVAWPQATQKCRAWLKSGARPRRNRETGRSFMAKDG
ncbi:spastin-like [Rhipicephalus microplus]|uniref:spastin-like n=1 Tax=Rhipicephalus microplus TaxID=6941 RepID=UPI003F6CB691